MRRIAWQIFWAFVVACVVAAAIALVAQRASGGLQAAGFLARLVETAWSLAPWALPGAAIAVVLSEWLGLRHALFHMLAGGATAILGAILKHGGVPASIMGADATGWSTPLITMGVAGGLGYWAMRGHKAGDGFAGTAARAGERRCWPCVLAGLAATALPLFLAAVWASHDGRWLEQIRDTAERSAATQLGKAGYDWASLNIDDAAGRIVGTAPDAAQRTAAFSKAEEVLAPMIGLPGVVSVLVNEITVAAPPVPAVTPPAAAPVTADADGTAKADATALAAKAAEAAARRRAEEERLAAEAAAKRKADEARAAAEAEAAKKADAERAERLAEEASARLKAEEARLAAEADAKRTADAEQAARAAAEAAAEAAALFNANAGSAGPQAANAPLGDRCLGDLERLVAGDRLRFGSAAGYLAAANRSFLDRVATGLRGCTDVTVEVLGHSDPEGSPEANLALSLRRAQSVSRSLIDRGIEARRISVRGLGETAPLWPAETPEAMAANRRIEFRFARDPAAIQASGNGTPAPSATTDTLAAGDAGSGSGSPSGPDACAASLAAISSTGKIVFGTGSSRIAASSQGLIRRLAGAVRVCTDRVVRIEGHTDSVGPADANQALSERRAGNVRDALIARGVPADRVTAQGFGESQPIYEAETPEAFARNRRIEFKVDRRTP